MVNVAEAQTNVQFKVAPRVEVPEELKEFDEVVAQLLLQRGITTRQAAEEFLNPRLDGLEDPYALKDMDKAVERIKRAVDRLENIVVYGDYDVDGVTSATVLIGAIRELGGVADVYLPERMKEGYGMNEEAITKLASEGANLIIAVDNGTTSVAEVALANKLGVDVIIVDHHHVPDKLPEAVALINPKRSDSEYAFKDLAAVGVTYRLAEALIGEKAQQFLDVVALGTVADVVPLVGENRTLTIFGLKALNETSRIGLQALIEVAELTNKELEVYHIGFQLGPRLNAAGRVDHAYVAFNLLNAKDEQTARELAEQLNGLNSQRQSLTDKILKAAQERDQEWRDENIIILGGEGWSVGVVGIVAGRLVERYSKPAIVFDYQAEVCKGSARSVDDVHIVELLNEVKDDLGHYGGHAKAAGMSVDKKSFDSFKTNLQRVAREKIDSKYLVPRVNVSLMVKPERVNSELLQMIERFIPFGFGNSTPVLATERVKLVDFEVMGIGASMLKLMFEDEAGKRLTIVGFDKHGELILSLNKGRIYDVAFNISSREWQGRKFMQARLVALKSNG